ncbi:hypothetical protein [Wenxinia marina]|uniref:Uncharacterized protein n=1 Tax=Wenxinia marina DSM 24838 TaxID=1123501 RepID=A0A0D0Q7Z9_9RHOB|nr:hypothetical protein [Wenxinia marina]KIQ70564.1 hypothetical protein Wenmar_00942 [Wenxinia marina DSM 24838]GGL52128.1 hypothetical protein GCM10011392_03080 [Wenxinia marina]
MRPVLPALAAILVLAGCLSPREACIASVSRELNTINSLIAETQGNLARGYALEERTEIYTVPRRCDGTNADGTTFTYSCPEQRTRSRNEPVAIDLNAERAKLNSLLERRASMEAGTNAAVRQCIASNPE